MQNVFGGRHDEDGLTAIDNPAESQAYYRVEEEFSNAIRGTEEITMVPFESGVHYIEWNEAVARSVQSGKRINLPQ